MTNYQEVCLWTVTTYRDKSKTDSKSNMSKIVMETYATFECQFRDGYVKEAVPDGLSNTKLFSTAFYSFFYILCNSKYNSYNHYPSLLVCSCDRCSQNICTLSGIHPVCHNAQYILYFWFMIMIGHVLYIMTGFHKALCAHLSIVHFMYAITKYAHMRFTKSSLSIIQGWNYVWYIVGFNHV